MQQAMIGHNLPPTDAEILGEKLSENSKADIERMSQILSIQIPEEILDETQAKWAADFIDKTKILKKTFDKTHEREKAPYLEMGRVVDGFFKTKINTLDAVLKKIAVPVNAYLDKKRAEEQRQIRERAEKARQEAEALAAQAVVHENEDIKDTASELMSAAVMAEEKAQALDAYAVTAKSAQLARVVTESGAKLAQRTVWTGEVQDWGAVDLVHLRPFLSQDAIQTAINKYVRDGGRELNGVKIYQKASI
jgi:ABC-type Fe3+/spermidine/putrescine transport system ATPase subunit